MNNYFHHHFYSNLAALGETSLIFLKKKKKSEMINSKLSAMMVVRVEYVDIYISLLTTRYLFHNKVIIS